MKRKAGVFLLILAAAGCTSQRIYAPMMVLMPPDPPAPAAGWWTGGEIGKIPAQYEGEGGAGLALFADGVVLSRFFRAELAGSVWGSSYRYTDVRFTGISSFISPVALGRGSLLLPIGAMRLETGLGAGMVIHAGAPREVDLVPFFLAGGVHAGVGRPGKFWFRAAYGVVNTGLALSVAVGEDLWVGGGFVRWWDEPRDWGLRLTLARRRRP